MLKSLLPLLLLVPLVACSEEPVVQAVDVDVERTVRDLITACTPPSATANSAIRNDWYARRTQLMDELRDAGPEVGRAVLDAYAADPEALLDVRRGLLEVAAHNAPEEAAPVLVQLFSEYGEHLGLRTKACELLAVAAPAEAVDLIAAVLEDRYPGRSYPPEETMVRAYEEACLAAQVDYVPLLSIVAADLYEDQTGRVMAVRALGRAAGVRSRETRRTVVVESAGNAQLRRGAAQSLLEQCKVDPETEAAFCSIMEEIMNKEADLNFQHFLVDVIEEHCR